MEDTKTAFRIGELSTLTNVKTGTIRFYEKCGFLSPVKRLSNGYRMFEKKHIYQVRICSLVFKVFQTVILPLPINSFFPVAGYQKFSP